jgi:hypothetical protein
MMKIFVIKSDHSEVPLAEVRTDGQRLEFVVDNTNGKLPAMFNNQYSRMMQIVTQSSHMQIESPKKATVNLLRYLMTNGDVVEITSDGHTVILNGNLLSQEEKDALFVAFQRGDIKVARQTPISQAVPVLPTKPKVEQSREKPKYDPSVMRQIAASQAKEAQAKEMSGPDYDHEIEEADLSGAEDLQWTKSLMYWLKHGVQK